MAEGAISKEDAALSKKKRKEKLANRPYPSVAYEIADQIKDAWEAAVGWIQSIACVATSTADWNPKVISVPHRWMHVDVR